MDTYNLPCTGRGHQGRNETHTTWHLGSQDQDKRIPIETTIQKTHQWDTFHLEALNLFYLLLFYTKLKGEGIKNYNDAITANPKNMDLEIQLKKLEIEKIKAEKWDWKYVPVNNYWPIPVSYSPVNQGQ